MSSRWSRPPGALCYIDRMSKAFDVVGVGLNATDTVLLAPHFPEYAGKAPFTEEVMSPGGQVASAIVACQRLGLRTKYIGSVGDDLRGTIQMRSLLDEGINVDHVQVRLGCPNQSAYIIVDQRTGVATPSAFTKRKALRPLKLAFSKPVENGFEVMIFKAATVSGLCAANCFICAGSGLPVAGSGFEAASCS